MIPGVGYEYQFDRLGEAKDILKQKVDSKEITQKEYNRRLQIIIERAKALNRSKAGGGADK
jgi:hypothetical protein